MDPQLQTMIDQLEAIGALGADAADAIAPIVKAELTHTINAGTTPEGEPWPLRKADGQKALQDAEEAVYVAAYKGAVYVRVKGPEARHHKGNVKGGVRRKIIPDKGKVPPHMAAAIKFELNKLFSKRAPHG